MSLKTTEAKLAREKEELKAKKTKGTEQRAARQAKTLPQDSFESNESDSEYFRVLPCPGDEPTSLNIFFGKALLNRFEDEATPAPPVLWA
eukprot:3854561-Rhodomonas_salina.1